jgi:hypothetical protein
MEHSYTNLTTNSKRKIYLQGHDDECDGSSTLFEVVEKSNQKILDEGASVPTYPQYLDQGHNASRGQSLEEIKVL